ncbi:signal peptidase I [Hazenella sp. IB182357]|uniref:Signal peptidase I n=1 Tax=Polycladospora coralii TaxID=2771432 RepID=A0A926NBU6_9BACL|nr:signal peptidase I [Polycladospora coralii]MBD1373377.1 signal peptidase I [Polycladospora coralii]MBS7531625.1 signal peptidase I [Polycladospora coralii]
MKLKIGKLSIWLICFAFAVLFAYSVNQYGFALSIVNGTSMQPTLHDGDRLLINRFKFLLDTPQVGDVVTFKDPSTEGRYLVKRVVGLAGDIIEIENGTLYRNGEKIAEQYIDTPIEDGNYGPKTVEFGTIFVMGDNRERYASRDSRYDSVGLIPYQLLDGKVEMILWRPSLSASL